MYWRELNTCKHRFLPIKVLIWHVLNIITITTLKQAAVRGGRWISFLNRWKFSLNIFKFSLKILNVWILNIYFELVWISENFVWILIIESVNIGYRFWISLNISKFSFNSQYGQFEYGISVFNLLTKSSNEEGTVWESIYFTV